MYGLERDTDLSFLLGRELKQVAIGIGQVQLRFDIGMSGVHISIESSFDIRSGRKTISGVPLPHGAANLLDLLGEKVQKVDILKKGTLSLLFSNDTSVIIYDDDPYYEAYSIETPEGESIIV